MTFRKKPAFEAYMAAVQVNVAEFFEEWTAIERGERDAVEMVE